ncbi:MAG TPA: 3,4-dioxygenase subunit beta [Micromonosporaceae bacterium]|jgi:protocatechuate 3,4-dioxygenase beta subunit
MTTDPHAHDHGAHEHDRGLSLDLPTLLSRRRLLGILGGVGAAAVAGCAATDDGTTTAGGTSTATANATSGATAAATATAGTRIPEETAGPYPGDGSNGVNVLTDSGIVRSDIVKSFGASSGQATGVPLTIVLTVLDTASGSAPRAGAAVYVWHCDSAGRYSLYDREISDENYLRGVQETDARGSVRFTSIFPAAYSGRWPHIHFEVYPSLAKATTASDKLRTSQLALPEAACRQVYATAGYEQSLRNLAQTSLATDNVFRDGHSLQLGTVTGDVSNGMTVTLNVPV